MVVRQTPLKRKQLKRRPIFTTDYDAAPFEDYTPIAGLGHNKPPPPPPAQLNLPEKFIELTQPARFKVWYGGRGAAKSHSFAQVLIAKAHTEKHLILCTRQFQSSIADSVYRVIINWINTLGLSQWFEITKTSIRSKVTGSEFIFKGIYHHPEEIKSLEGVTICWVEEAQAMTEESWLILEPTIRVNHSEIWVSFNPENGNDATFQRFVVRPPPDAIVRKVNWRDNPYFSDVLDKQRRYMKQVDPEAYDWVWEGNLRKITDAAIFKGKWIVEAFETPEVVDRFYYGADWGFANDPSCMLRCFIKDENLYVDHEAFGVGVELEDLPALFAGGVAPISGIEYPGVPGAKDWPVKADSARPETISYVARNGSMNITACEKWKGCVEDGIMHLRSFRRIIIHERCTNLATEARLYSYKTDPRQLDDEGKPVILPVVVDKHNHGWDALRYALEHFIIGRGKLGVWERLGGFVSSQVAA